MRLPQVHQEYVKKGKGFDLNPKIVFLHIPKTAGMSLRGLFIKNYRTGKHFNTELKRLTASDWDRCLARIKNIPGDELNQYQVFKGHMQFGLHEILPSPVEYITFLRNPVKRILSHYKMLCRNKIIPSDPIIDLSKSDWNLTSYPELCYSLDNGQTRAMAGVDPDLPFGACTEKHLQMALENMERHFKFVGLTEQFNLSLLLLGRVCGWKWHFYMPDNVAKNISFQLPPDVVEAIRDLNRLDFELYRRAEERFEQLADSYGWKLKAEHRLYNLGNRLHQHLHVGRHWLRRRLGIERRKAMMPNPVMESTSINKSQFLS